jgi:hypothetical protein
VGLKSQPIPRPLRAASINAAVLLTIKPPLTSTPTTPSAPRNCHSAIRFEPMYR